MKEDEEERKRRLAEEAARRKANADGKSKSKVRESFTD